MSTNEKIRVTNPPKVLLLGNGIVRAFCNKQSCQDLITKIAEKFPKSEIPPEGLPFPFKVIAVSKNNEEQVKKELKDCFQDSKDCFPPGKNKKEFEQLRQWLMPLVKTYKVILTTNYTYEIEYALDPDFKPGSRKYYKWLGKGDHKSAKAHLGKHYEIKVDGIPVKIWHVHGEMVRPSGITLGLYQYGRLIGLNRTRVADILKKWMLLSDKDFQYESWLEYFLFGDLSIVGFGFDLAEIDLWCMLDCKYRHNEDASVTFYAHDLSTEIKTMLKAYKVEVQEGKDVGMSPDYERFYKKVAGKLLKG